MTRARRLPRAVTDRRSFFVGRFDDVILSDGRLVVLPSVVLSLSNKRFADHVLARVPKSGRISFRLGSSVIIGHEETAFMDALIKVWRANTVEPEVESIGNELLNEFVKILKAKAPGAINAAFGGLFTP